MKKLLYIVLIVGVIIGGIFYFSDKKSNTNPPDLAQYVGTDVGLQFDYKTGDDGYVIDERMPVDLGTGLVKVVMVTPAADANRQPPEGGELPPVITISVFENTKKQFPTAWAQQNTQYSNFNLKLGDATETVVGGANALRYMADGLYASDTVVVAHGDNMYVISGQFMDAESQLRKDFEPLVQSITFIPKPGQE